MQNVGFEQTWNLFKFSFPKNNLLTGKKLCSGNHLSGHHWYFWCAKSWPVSNKYIYKIYKVREMHRHYVQGDIMFIFYCWKSKFIMKIEMKLHTCLGTCYFVLLDAILGARQVHNMSVCLIFPALNRCLITLGVESSIISIDSNVTDNIIRKVKIYSRKSAGPKMEPWVTVVLTGYSCEDFPPRTTWSCLILRKDRIRQNIQGVN